MENSEIEQLEIDLLLTALHERYGYDFRMYSRDSLERRVRGYMQRSGKEHIAELIAEVLWKREVFEAVVREFSITVTSMFRDPDVYRSLREQVFPLLRTHPFIRIWHAGCATGEEVYSLAICLHEEGLYERSTIFATDFNDEALRIAEKGIYELSEARGFTESYQEAGGKASFADYYQASYNCLAIDSKLKRRITFANHNLATDGVFSEVHLVVCRNVLIYFDKELQSQVFGLFHDSLVRGGFLCLGSGESLLFSGRQSSFHETDCAQRIYQKKYQ